MKNEPLQYGMHDGLMAFRPEFTGVGTRSTPLRTAGSLGQISRVSTVGRRTVDTGFAMLVVAFLVLAIFGSPVEAASLQAKTIAAWDAYLQRADGNLQERLCSGNFLWALEDTDRAIRVRAGEIVVAPAPGPSPRKVPGGLIHHWIGAVFLPDLKIDDVIGVTRDYDRYKNFYSPSVIDSKLIARNGLEDRFSMRLMNRSFLLKSALDADYEADNVRVDDHRYYSVAKATRVQEIGDAGEPGEHRMPEGEGAGYIWKLYSVARLQERDGGVYLELEAIALSRDIPAPIRFAVDPIVRRISHNSILLSLRQTVEAVHRSAAIPVSARPAARGRAVVTSFH